MAGLGIVAREKSEVTVDSLKEMFPSKKGTITDEVVDIINSSQQDPSFSGDEFIDALVTYKDVMVKNSASIKQYIDAIKFCAYLEAENDNFTEAYKRAFAHRQFVIDKSSAVPGSPEYNELTSAASRYRKRPIVVDILTQTDMPLYLMFQGERYKAVAVLADEMRTADYSKDRIAAADKLLTHVKPPEGVKVELDVGVRKDSQIDRYEEMISQLVAKQKQDIINGGDLHSITNVAIVAKTEEEILEGEIE
jgi:hypothetical protein